MKKGGRVLFVLTVVLAALGLVIMGCDLGGNGGATRKITGIVRDSVNGDPVNGATVTFGDSSATTGADGSFSLDLGASSGVVISSWSMRASGYDLTYWEQVSVDGSQDADVPVYINRLGVDTAMGDWTDYGYSTHQIDLTVKDSGGNEIPTGWRVEAEVLNSNGGSDRGTHLTYTNGGPNTFDTPSFGSDCLVVATVEDDAEVLQFVVWAKQVDLSASTTPLTLTATDSPTIVDITADAVGNLGMITLITPYGSVEGGFWEFSPNASLSGVEVYNPYVYEGSWAQMSIDTSDPNYDKLLLSTSSVSSIATPVALPAIDATLGPDEGYTGFSVTYSDSTGVLAWPAVSEASFYAVSIYTDAAPLPGSYRPAQFYLASESITLPQWLRDDLAGLTATVIVTAGDGSGTADLSDLVGAGDFPPDMKWGFANKKGGMDPGEGYEVLISF
jgi:hypothetical protein